MDLESQLYNGLANKAKYDTALDFVSGVAYHERDWNILKTFSIPTVWIALFRLVDRRFGGPV